MYSSMNVTFFEFLWTTRAVSELETASSGCGLHEGHTEAASLAVRLLRPLS